MPKIAASDPARAQAACRRKFLRVFPKGFQDQKYLTWERDHKWEAHERWQETLNKKIFAALLEEKDYPAIAQRAMAVESRTNLLFSFEKMALRDAVKLADGARTFALALYDRLYAGSRGEAAFDRFVAAVESLPRKQTRVVPVTFIPPERVITAGAPSWSGHGAAQYQSNGHYSRYSLFVQWLLCIRGAAFLRSLAPAGNIGSTVLLRITTASILAVRALTSMAWWVTLSSPACGWCPIVCGGCK